MGWRCLLRCFKGDRRDLSPERCRGPHPLGEAVGTHRGCPGEVTRRPGTLHVPAYSFKIIALCDFYRSNIRGGEGKGAVGRVGPPGARVGLPPWRVLGDFPGHPDTRSPVRRLIWGGHRGEGPSGGAAVCSFSESLAKV